MDLGTAVLLFFIGCGVGLLGLVFLVGWLFRIAKRNPKAAKVYHVLTAITGIVLVSAVVIILFFLPKPLSKLPQELLDCYPIAHSGKDFWAITQPVRGHSLLSVTISQKSVITRSRRLTVNVPGTFLCIRSPLTDGLAP